MNFLVVSGGRTRSTLMRKTAMPFLVVLLVICVCTLSYAQSQPSIVPTQAAQKTQGNKQLPGPAFSKLTQEAEVIVVGKVTDTRSEWNAEKTRIYTRVTVSVDEYLKGSQSRNTLTILNLGGEVGTEGELYNEAPVFRKDEEILVFTRKDKQGNLRVVGGKQGKSVVTAGKAGGSKMVDATRSLNDVKLEIKSTLTTGR